MQHYFKLTTDLIKADFTLTDKYILIDGFSGSGKSTFISELERDIYLDGHKVG